MLFAIMPKNGNTSYTRGMRALVVVSLLLGGMAPVRAEVVAVDKGAASRTELGQRLFAVGRYAEALAAFEAARKTAPRPELDLLIARCYERLSDNPRAIEAYTHYIESTPTPLDADAVLTHIGELRGAKPAVLLAPVIVETAPQVMVERPGRGLRIAGIVIGGVGLAAVGTGIGMGVAGDQAADAATARARAGLVYDHAQDDQIASDRLAQGVLIGIGAAAVVAGVVCLAVGSRRPTAKFARLSPAGVRF